MQGPLLVFLMLVVISAVIGAVSQVLKNAAQQPAPMARPRPRPAAGQKPAATDIDKFLEEIDRLRKRKAEADGSERSEPPVAAPVARPPARPQPQPTARAVPTAEPRRKRKPDPQPKAETKPTARPVRVNDLPVAPAVSKAPPPPAAESHRPVVTAPLQLAALPKVTSGPMVTASPNQPKKTAFSRQLTGLLATPQAVPMAVVLAEILGPPKCRQG